MRQGSDKTHKDRRNEVADDEARLLRERERLRRWREENRERAREIQRAYRKRNAERIRAKARARTPSERERALNREKSRRWRERNPERWKEVQRAHYERRDGAAQMREWRKRNPEKVVEARRRQYERNDGAGRVREWRERNPEKAAAISSRSNWKRRGARPKGLALEYAAVLRDDPCSYCGGPAGTVDHIAPVSRGGDSAWSNLTAACRSCNSRKRDRSLLEHLLVVAHG